MTESEADTAVVRYAQDGNVVVLTIDRPEARNAVNAAVANELEAAIDRFEADETAWVAILTGAGTTFSAGADLKEVAAGRGRELSTDRGGFAGLVIRERAKPIIAAVNGPALAGGCEILLACDMVVAAAGIPIGVPEVKRSLVAAAGALWRLPRTVGPAKAAEMILTGDPITAEDALAHGLVNAVVPADEVLDAAKAMAGRIAVNAPLAVQASRGVMIRAFDEEPLDLFKLSGRAFLTLIETEDFQEGPRAFIEKRDPVWQGR